MFQISCVEFHVIAEASLQQLNHALKILSETEKQLRASNSQTTWLIVALLQLSSVGNSLSDAHDLRMCEKLVQPTGENGREKKRKEQTDSNNVCFLDKAQ